MTASSQGVRHPLSPGTVEWIRSFQPRGAIARADSAWVGDGDVMHGITRVRDGWSEVLFKERGDPVATLARARPAYAERYFVWRIAGDAQWELRRERTGYPIAPERVPAAGPLTVRENGDGTPEVLADDEIVAVFPRARGEAIEFTHYGSVPVGLLIAQIMLPPSEMLFLAGARHRSDEDQQTEADRLRRGVLDLLRRP